MNPMSKAIRGGIRAGLVSGSPSTSSDMGVSLSPPNGRFWRLSRNFGRRSLQRLRPLASPFLLRFEWRVRTAVRKELATLSWHENPRQTAAIAQLQQTLMQVAEQNARLVEQVTRLHEETNLLLQRNSIPLDKNEFLVRTPHGWLILPGDDEALLSFLTEAGGVPERGTTRVLEALLRPGDTMVDVGANVGTMTLPAARRVGPSGRVISIEPLPRLATLLRRSLAINGLNSIVTLHACAAGDTAGRGTLNVVPILSHSSLLPLETGGQQIAVDVRPLDALVPVGQPVALVKIDAERFELSVWRGMSRLIADSPDLAVIVEYGPSHLRRAGVSAAEWIAELRAPGFKMYEIDENDGSCRLLRQDGMAEVHSLNVLLLRQPIDRYPELRCE